MFPLPRYAATVKNDMGVQLMRYNAYIERHSLSMLPAAYHSGSARWAQVAMPTVVTTISDDPIEWLDPPSPATHAPLPVSPIARAETGDSKRAAVVPRIDAISPSIIASSEHKAAPIDIAPLSPAAIASIHSSIASVPSFSSSAPSAKSSDSIVPAPSPDAASSDDSDLDDNGLPHLSTDEDAAVELDIALFNQRAAENNTAQAVVRLASRSPQKIAQLLSRSMAGQRVGAHPGASRSLFTGP